MNYLLIKQLVIAITAVLSLNGTAQTDTNSKPIDPLLVIVLMVKNEEQVIEATLQPYIDAGIQSYLIFDTGSTDNTVGVVEQYFKTNKITAGYIEQEPFIDFATSRNRALALARAQFPNAGFMLMLDAEWYMHDVPELIAFCKEEKNKHEPAYLVRIGDDNFEFYTPRLMRCASDIKFVGSVHEVLDYGATVKVPGQAYFELRQSNDGQKKSALRWQRDAKILQKRYEDDPTDTRNLFYLAQTYACLGDWEHAYEYYFKRAQLEGWSEENYVTLFKLADTIEHLVDQKDEKKWLLALHYYLQAYTMRPQRIEPLVRIAQHYVDNGTMHLAFCFARQACSQLYPVDDILFVEKELYSYTRYDILGRAAWYVGEYEIGEEAVRMALRARPDMPHLHRNLEFYTQRREELEVDHKKAPVHSLFERLGAQCRLLFAKIIPNFAFNEKTT